MALDFPTSPSIGQKYPAVPVAGQPVYTWDGEKWNASAGSSIPTILVSDTAPTNAPDGALWWESDSGLLFLRYSDGDTSQWVIAAPQPDISVFAPKASPVFTGDPQAPTPATADNDTSIATTAFVKAQGYAPLADPALTGNPTAPTPTAGDSDTSIATTAFVTGEINSKSVRYDSAQAITSAQQIQARQNVYAAPFGALTYSGIQINGAFDVDGIGAGTVTSTTGWQYVCDGWGIAKGGSMVFTGTKASSGGLFPLPNMLSIAVTTAQTSLAGSDYAATRQLIEGFRISRLNWGRADAQPLTIAFWSAHARTGIYCIAASNTASARTCVVTYTQNVASAAEYKTVTFPGCTDGTWDAGTGMGCQILFTIAAGSTYNAPVAGVWNTTNYIAVSGQVNGVTATSDVFRITGVIIISGNEAPSAARSPLIMRIWTDEVPICQRYYLKETYVGGGLWMFAIDTAATYRRGFFRFPVPMRIVPVVTVTGTASGGFVATHPKVSSITPFSCELQGDVSSGYSYISTIIADARL